MSEAINKAVERQARQIIRIERWLVIFSAVCAVALLAAALYFERSYGVAPYSFAFAAAFFLGSLACFWGLFAIFGEGFRPRVRKREARALFMLASLYMVLASLVSYAVAFGLFGLQVPWTGDGREYLYACYFLMSVAAIFLARSVMFYRRLRSYITESLGNLNK
jgi:MFS family permease